QDHERAQGVPERVPRALQGDAQESLVQTSQHSRQGSAGPRGSLSLFAPATDCPSRNERKAAAQVPQNEQISPLDLCPARRNILAAEPLKLMPSSAHRVSPKTKRSKPC